MEPKGSLPCSQEHNVGFYQILRLCAAECVGFYISDKVLIIVAIFLTCNWKIGLYHVCVCVCVCVCVYCNEQKGQQSDGSRVSYDPLMNLYTFDFFLSSIGNK